MDSTLDEAEGHDAAMVDPDAATRAEEAGMVAGEKRRERIALELASPAGRPAKVSRPDASPVGVADVISFEDAAVAVTE